MTKLLALLVTLLSLTSYISTPSFSNNWQQYSIDISGKSISFSSIPGHFRDIYIQHIDITKNQKDHVTLFKQSWVFSGFIADKGMLSFSIGLNKAKLGDTETEFQHGIKDSLSNAYIEIFPNGVELKNITKKQMGGHEWLCYTISNWLPECALRLDSEHYLSWKFVKTDNQSTDPIKERDELQNKIEQSVKISF